MKAADKAGSRRVQDRDFCVLVMLDVENAFNSVPWTCIDTALQRKRPPQYISEMVRSYLQDRSITAGVTCKGISCGVPQASVSGPTL